MIWGSEDGNPIEYISTDTESLIGNLNEQLIDDFTQDSNTLGIISDSGIAPGSLETNGDRDWFSFYLNAGDYLQLQLNGYSNSNKLCPCFSCNQKQQIDFLELEIMFVN